MHHKTKCSGAALEAHRRTPPPPPVSRRRHRGRLSPGPFHGAWAAAATGGSARLRPGRLLGSRQPACRTRGSPAPRRPPPRARRPAPLCWARSGRPGRRPDHSICQRAHAGPAGSWPAAWKWRRCCCRAGAGAGWGANDRDACAAVSARTAARFPPVHTGSSCFRCLLLNCAHDACPIICVHAGMLRIRG